MLHDGLDAGLGQVSHHRLHGRCVHVAHGDLRPASPERQGQ